MMKQENELKEAIRYLLKFMPEWVREVPDGLCPIMYGTLSAEGDRKVKARVDQIRTLVDSPSTKGKGI